MGAIKNYLANLPPCVQLGCAALGSLCCGCLVGTTTEFEGRGLVAGVICIGAAGQCAALLVMIVMDILEGRDWHGEKL